MPALAQDTSAAPRPHLSWRDHPEVEWPGRIRMEFHARVQSDIRMSDAAVERGRGDSFDVGRRRIGIEGEIGKDVEFQLEGEIEQTKPWRDAFINVRRVRTAQVQAGQFKIPFGLEETTSGGSLDFIYRSLVSARLAPGRDNGLMMHGRLAAKTLGYEIGVFAHDGDNARPNGGRRVFGGRTIAGRLAVEPFRKSKSRLSDLQLGAAFTQSALPEGFPAIRGRSVLGVSFFDSDLWVAGGRRRIGMQARWRPGRLSVASEFIRVSDDRLGQSPAGEDLPPFLARGWYVSGTWVVAGAARAAKVTQPDRPLFHGGFGSIQLALRLEQLRLGGDARTASSSTSPRAESMGGNGDTAVTFGTTWHPNRWVAVEGNIIREAIGAGARDPFPRARFWSRLVRVQLEI
jgi:phosphate-selective porin OprO/OprP